MSNYDLITLAAVAVGIAAAKYIMGRQAFVITTTAAAMWFLWDYERIPDEYIGSWQTALVFGGLATFCHAYKDEIKKGFEKGRAEVVPPEAIEPEQPPEPDPEPIGPLPKMCPECKALNRAEAKMCIECGFPQVIRESPA